MFLRISATFVLAPDFFVPGIKSSSSVLWKTDIVESYALFDACVALVFVNTFSDPHLNWIVFNAERVGQRHPASSSALAC